jgi:hypothetical protein
VNAAFLPESFVERKTIASAARAAKNACVWRGNRAVTLVLQRGNVRNIRDNGPFSPRRNQEKQI